MQRMRSNSCRPKRGVQAIDVVALTAETVAAVAAMNENVAAEYAEFVVPAVGVADDDEFHRVLLMPGRPSPVKTSRR